jgi:hypothetical protein
MLGLSQFVSALDKVCQSVMQYCPRLRLRSGAAANAKLVGAPSLQSKVASFSASVVALTLWFISHSTRVITFR